MIANQKKGETVEIKETFTNHQSNGWFNNGIHTWLERADARGRAGIMTSQSRSRAEYLISAENIIAIE